MKELIYLRLYTTTTTKKKSNTTKLINMYVYIYSLSSLYIVCIYIDFKNEKNEQICLFI
jgi:hypothetical protein